MYRRIGAFPMQYQEIHFMFQIISFDAEILTAVIMLKFKKGCFFNTAINTIPSDTQKILIQKICFYANKVPVEEPVKIFNAY